MDAGVAVIVADAGALPEVVGDAGVRFPPGDDVQLAVELHRILSDDGPPPATSWRPAGPGPPTFCRRPHGRRAARRLPIGGGSACSLGPLWVRPRPTRRSHARRRPAAAVHEPPENATCCSRRRSPSSSSSASLLVFYARDNRQAQALEAPLLSDHWHSAYGFYICDAFLPNLPEFVAPQNGGIHTHGDGLLHIHPFSTSRSGENATLDHFLADAGAVLGNEGGVTDDSIHVPGGRTYTEGKDTCDGLDGEPIVQVAIWDSAADGRRRRQGRHHRHLRTSTRLRFTPNGQAFTIAFAPEGHRHPARPSPHRPSPRSATTSACPQDSIPPTAEQPNATDSVHRHDRHPTDTTDTTTTGPTTDPIHGDPTTTEADAGQ